MPATYLVTNTAELKRVLWLQRGSRVVISSSRMVQTERKRLQERMNRLLAISGYGLGLAGMVAMLSLSVLWVGGHWRLFVAHWFVAAGLGAAACLFAWVVGRAVGLLYARCRLVRLICGTVTARSDHFDASHGIGAERARLLTRRTIA